MRSIDHERNATSQMSVYNNITSQQKEHYGNARLSSIDTLEDPHKRISSQISQTSQYLANGKAHRNSDMAATSKISDNSELISNSKNSKGVTLSPNFTLGPAEFGNLKYLPDSKSSAKINLIEEFQKEGIRRDNIGIKTKPFNSVSKSIQQNIILKNHNNYGNPFAVPESDHKTKRNPSWGPRSLKRSRGSCPELRMQQKGMFYIIQNRHIPISYLNTDGEKIKNGTSKQENPQKGEFLSRLGYESCSSVSDSDFMSTFATNPSLNKNHLVRIPYPKPIEIKQTTIRHNARAFHSEASSPIRIEEVDGKYKLSKVPNGHRKRSQRRAIKVSTNNRKFPKDFF